MIGQTVGDYRITGLISDKGGFGVVYKAVHRLLEQEVAIKTLHQFLTGEARFRDRFFAEARAQARLRHENIVGIHNFFEHNGRYFIVMELMDGMVVAEGKRVRSLAELIKLGPMPEERALSVFRQVLAGVGYAHRHGVLHRDLKPLNVLFNEQGTAKVGDFGLAKMLAPGQGEYSLTRGGMGTPAYMSPEQVLNKVLDARADIYALGITLYEMLAGRIPFNATSTTSIEEQHLSEPPPPLRETNPDIPVELERAVLKALAKKPEERFQSCEEFAAALARTREARMVVVPGFCGKTRAEAEPLGRQVGLRVEQIAEEHSDDVPAGTVLRQEPEFGAVVEDGTLVRLVVSKGPRPKPVSVPELRDRQKVEAERMLAELGLKLAVGSEEFSRKVKQGAVVGQTPEAGVMLEPGGVVTVVLSKGPKLVSVPALGGLTQAEAEGAAAALGLRLVVSGKEPSEYIAAGRVLRQASPAGVRLAEGSELSVVLSLGVQERQVEVPDVRGRLLEEAEGLLAGVGLTPTVEHEDFSEAAQAGTVTWQSPPPGALLNQGETVALVLSKSKEPRAFFSERTVREPSPGQSTLERPASGATVVEKQGRRRRARRSRVFATALAVMLVIVGLLLLLLSNKKRQVVDRAAGTMPDTTTETVVTRSLETSGELRTTPPAVSVFAKTQIRTKSTDGGTPSRSFDENFELGAEAIRAGKYDEAIRYYGACINQNPNHPTPYANRGLAYYCKGEYWLAIEDFSMTLKLEPTSAWTWSWRGEAYHKVGNEEQAVSDWREAHRLLSEYPKSPYARAAINAEGAGNVDPGTGARSGSPALYVGSSSTMTTLLTGLGFNVRTSSSIPSNLSDYSVIVVENYDACNTTTAAYLRNRIAEGGGVVLTSGTPYFLAGGYSLPSWMGGGEYHNTFGNCWVNTTDGQILYSNSKCNGGAAITGTRGTVIAKWNDGSAAAVRYVYGSGRCAYFYSGAGTSSASDGLLTRLVLWAAGR
ncbi:MAG: PASTA domain-containing protein [candidate division WOR-3 bacterium]